MQEERAKHDNLGPETKRSLALVKKQMEENHVKDICRLKHSRKSATTFTVTFLYQMSNIHIHNKGMEECYCVLPLTGLLNYELYLRLS